MAQCRCGKRHFNNVSDCDDCLKASERVVGYVHMTLPRDLQDSFEAAQQYRTVRVDAGFHPIIVAKSRFDGSRYVVVRFQGVVTAAGYGAKQYETGHRETLPAQPYKYQLEDEKFWGGYVQVTDPETLATVRGV